MEVRQMMERVKSDVECFFLSGWTDEEEESKVWIPVEFGTFTCAPITLGKVPSPRSYGLNSKVDRTL